MNKITSRTARSGNHIANESVEVTSMRSLTQEQPMPFASKWKYKHTEARLDELKENVTKTTVQAAASPGRCPFALRGRSKITYTKKRYSAGG